MWLGAPPERCCPSAGVRPVSASAEDLAGDRRSKFQRYLIAGREWPVRQPGEDHLVPSWLSNAAIYNNMDTAPRHAATSVCTGTLTW